MNDTAANEPESEPTAIYSPAYRFNTGPITAVKALVRDVIDNRWRIWESFKRNFQNNYAGTILGQVWMVILPLVQIGVYVLLAQMRVVSRSEDIPFVLFICIGVTVYGMATGPIQDTMGAMRGESGMLSKTNISIITIVLSRFAQLVWDVLVRLVFIACVMVTLGVTPGWGVLLLPIALLPVFLGALSAGIILGILNIIARDVANTVGIIIRYGFFFSSVIFPLPKEGVIATILLFNPFNTFVIEIRNLIVKGHMENITLFLITSACTLLVFLFAAVFLYRSEARIRSAL
ncbi:ABC transporter permease [Hyphococcus flavus]|uniref:ABC transporter permease n=1 Tax=Hyphococcus flavus TaxID=1866326 RepID=A0AAE9ZGE3_9PROT|nr:ABC transporter permease [Hyphococcus flavus]WDI32478.1 ABC transporter permease [Hyphococcus flavus]